MARYLIAAWPDEVVNKARVTIAQLGGAIVAYRPDLMKASSEPGKPIWEVEAPVAITTLQSSGGVDGGYEVILPGGEAARTQPADPGVGDAEVALGLKMATWVKVLGGVAILSLGAIILKRIKRR